MAKAQCIYCEAETSLHLYGRPVCTECSDMLDSGETPPRKGAEREKPNGDSHEGAA